MSILFIYEGDKKRDYYCPTGFRFLTNIHYIDDKDGSVCEDVLELLQKCWKYYGGVSVGPAFTSVGTIMDDHIGIFVKTASPIRECGHVIGKICSKCGMEYMEDDMIQVDTFYRKTKLLCKNCFFSYEYKHITVGDKIVLVSRFRDWI